MSGVAGKVLQESWAVPMVQMFHTLGLVKQSIARSSDEYEGQYRIDGENTVFGKVISGFSTIDKIANLKSGGDEWPLVDVFIKAEVIR